jgi:hypothetical protein
MDPPRHKREVHNKTMGHCMEEFLHRQVILVGHQCKYGGVVQPCPHKIMWCQDSRRLGKTLKDSRRLGNRLGPISRPSQPPFDLAAIRAIYSPEARSHASTHSSSAAEE